MSFAAVVSLIAFYEVLRDRYASLLFSYSLWRRVPLYIVATIITTIVSSVATAPYALYHFQRLAMFPSLIANMIAVPLTGFLVMPMALIGLILMPFGLEGAFFDISLWGVAHILDTSAWVADMPGSVMYGPVWPLSALVCVTLGGLWMVIWQGWLRLAGVIPICIGIALIPTLTKPDILISAEGKQIAIHAGEGVLALSNARAERFTRTLWVEEFGGKEPIFWPRGEGALPEVHLNCDVDGCVHAREGYQIAFPWSEMALYADCKGADLVIAPQFYDLPKICEGTQQITRGDLKRGGAHALYV